MKFRPCIDLHDGKVKQIIGSTLRAGGSAAPQTNFSSRFPPSHYSRMYRQDDLTGGHVIMLGPGNEEAAMEALAAWPGGLQIGGGINDDNAALWLERGASHVIVTSYVFHDGILDENRLRSLCNLIGRRHLVLDLSCRRKDDTYFVVTDRWQKFTRLAITRRILDDLAVYCDEFLVHAVDVEGKCMGVDAQLIEILAASTRVPVTYAGGVSTMADLELIAGSGYGKLDVTVGSALDIFGGNGLRYADVVAFCGKQKQESDDG
ncbi:MAG TPA: phosphoribosylformimino-5-aminoimidazole carboxamide ribotide isomerase [Desulfobulbaceae bacterium]|nr:phosphoribosylformimino-5-aminoimidazole carboxamide ribotide isomerase [Desulfobulbaceae bacterium]